MLPWATLPCLYSASLAAPYFHINDIHVAGFAAEMCGFPRQGEPGFYPGKFVVAATEWPGLLIGRKKSG